MANVHQLATEPNNQLTPVDDDELVRVARNPPKLELSVGVDPGFNIPKSQYKSLMKAMGTDEIETVISRLRILYDSVPVLAGEQFNAILDDIDSLQPRDAVEWTLVQGLIQAREHYSWIMTQLLRTANYTEYADMAKAAERFGKLNTLNADSLAKYRRKGKQQVVVKHLHVAEGGQAVVANQIDGKTKGAQ